MDSLHLLHLGFLLLAVAASHPNIAISSEDPAEGTEDSSSGKTKVTVYHCKDCESSTCSQSISFENFEKIAETEKEVFSNGIIDLVTNETHILMCFQQTNTFAEGICGIFWDKAEKGAELMCGILNSGENGRDNISTEEYRICCEAETNLWESSSTMKCYTEPSGRKAFIPPSDIAGNPEFLTSKTNSTGILCAFLFVGVCTGWAIIYYCLRRGRDATVFFKGDNLKPPLTPEIVALQCSAGLEVQLCCHMDKNPPAIPASRQGRQAPDEEHLTHA